MKLHYGASGFMIIAGIIHIMIAPAHWQHAPAHGLFFALSGMAQVIWGIVYWRKPTSALRNFGVIMAGALIALYVITRIFSAPFGDEPGELEFTGIASKVMEGAALISLAALSVSGEESRRTKISRWVDVGKIVALSFVVGGLAYQVSIAAEPLFPWLGEEYQSQEADPSVAQSSMTNTPNAPDQLELVVAGFGKPFSNGEAIPVVGDILANMTVIPGNERYNRDLELYLYHEASSKPIDDAMIQLTGSMRFMEHGTFQAVAINLDDGNYLVQLPFPMPGEWQLEIEIIAPDGTGKIRLDIDLFE